MKKKIVVLGGGTGLSFLVRDLKDFPVELTSVITVADNGCSTGKLRKEFNIPAVGDIRQVLSNLSTLTDDIKNFMEHRFETYSDLDGHALGNLMLTSMINKTGSLKTAIEYLSKLLYIKHSVLPLSEDNLTLVAVTEDGSIYEGEESFSKVKNKIKKVYYKENIHILPEVIESIHNADMIILSMGSLYTSIVPHLLAKDVIDSINKSKAKLLYVCNAMTQIGETDNFTVGNHIDILEKYLGKNKIDIVIASNSKINDEYLNNYLNTEQKQPVLIDYENLKKKNIELVEEDLLTTKDGTIKHDSMKLALTIFNILMR